MQHFTMLLTGFMSVTGWLISISMLVKKDEALLKNPWEGIALYVYSMSIMYLIAGQL